MITKETPIIVVLRSHIQAKEVLVSHGMSCSGCMGSATETIANAAKIHGVNIDALLAELNSLKSEK
ncbi:Hypothetical protein LUCI_3192 [Lucifera butyrica]|uniref:DUF1858 domain-containing protein n=1 Tax=Lucifera butyrica TaxID=1351585 RepID=A0A498RAL8_9FIRM|nr:DUF1858 domain-containing protein [Lucifera butyrica]VBB07927.1 Hypothetical protein LUCI_3192 [Lucifera butyrica]